MRVLGALRGKVTVGATSVSTREQDVALGPGDSLVVRTYEGDLIGFLEYHAPGPEADAALAAADARMAETRRRIAESEERELRRR